MGEPVSIEQKATEALQAINNRDMSFLASNVHESKGVFFSPTSYIEDYTVGFRQNEVEHLLEDDTKYVWGYGEARTEISLTSSEYFDERLRAELFLNADKVHTDVSNMIDSNLEEVFPQSKIVEFYIEGTSDLDWKSLKFVYELNEYDIWKIVAIVNGRWEP
ncbi:hypothetical protein [Radiobacillus sp. PE A8.2]|uniref:hypothetical protein n=1 Tax=Radiobacillus sp. PE A8.2 TaxID=3380349 RepID=UPI00388EDEEE